MNNEQYGYDTIVAEKDAIARMKKYAKDHGIKMYRAVGSAINEYLDKRVNNYEERNDQIPIEAVASSQQRINNSQERNSTFCSVDRLEGVDLSPTHKSQIGDRLGTETGQTRDEDGTD